ncbi:MAG TPA: hypothetical protein VGS20_17300 [Candidatus Acidoferrales bacterium]|nr:hypothetical protein [Candidatus Acidoferrales bacterium]
MPQSLLIFDFGSDEQAAQQARHRLDGWRQAFRLGDRVKSKFERKPAEPPAAGTEPPAQAPPDGFRLLVRLEFSDHEKLSYQRWFDRIPSEEPFKAAARQVLRRGQDGYAEAEELFDNLKEPSPRFQTRR